MKICTKCKKEKETNKLNFIWITNKNRFQAQCRQCMNERAKELRNLKPKLPKKNRDKKPPEYFKEYRKKWIQENREHVRELAHKNYLKNRDSVLARTKKWRQENKSKFKEMWDKSNKKNPHKRHARKLLNRCIDNGKIIKPNECSMCGNKSRIKAHHTDYSKPFEVQWLCSSCHAYIHRKFKE